MTPLEIKHIVNTGKLSGYLMGGGFLQVQWTTPDLDEAELWLFKFTGMDNKLVSVEKTKPSPFGFFRKRQARKYVPMINSIMSDLVVKV